MVGGAVGARSYGHGGSDAFTVRWTHDVCRTLRRAGRTGRRVCRPPGRPAEDGAAALVRFAQGGRVREGTTRETTSPALFSPRDADGGSAAGRSHRSNVSGGRWAGP
ncbi:hypothetical protein KNE206_61570 [Kitasatospora sp. NE20-6]